VAAQGVGSRDGEAVSAQVVERRVGRYVILREIGRGGMSVVYLARQTDLERNVALKELATFYSADPAFAERFVRESRIAGAFSHPNIVTVHDYFEHEGTPYIAMEYLERGSLRPLIGRLSLPQVVGVLEGLLAALSHAEAQGIVHRDLKPENLMVTAEGGVKTADFGIAKALNQAATGRLLTATGTTIGTPTYMAPEQAMGREVGPWTDLYSLGVMAYEMLVGLPPYHDTEAPMAILLRHVNDPVPSVSEANPQLNPALAAWVERLLQKEPAARYQRAHDAWEELEDIVVSDLGPLWRREARLARLPIPEETPEPEAPASFPEADVAPSPVEDPPERSSFQTFLPQRAQEVLAQPPAVEQPPFAEPDEQAPAVSHAELAQVSPPVGPDEPAEALQPVEPDEQPASTPVGVDAPVPDLLATVPPTSRPRATSFVWPVASGGALRRLRSRWVAAAALVPAVVVAAVLVVGRGSHESVADQPSSPGGQSGPRTNVPDLPLAPSERLTLALDGDHLYVGDPKGRVVQLRPKTLTQEAVAADPAGPQSMAALERGVVVADGRAMMFFGPRELLPAWGLALKAPALLAGDSRVSLAGAFGGASPRVCGMAKLEPGPCAAFSFVPTGLGVSQSGTVAVADGGTGSVVLLRSASAKLVPTAPIRVGTKPHGTLQAFRGKLYVPVQRGVAVVDIAGRKLERTIRFETTPSSIWIVPFNGRLFAALPASHAVAVVDAASPAARASLTTLGSRAKPAAVVGPLGSDADGNIVYVVDGANGTIGRLDALTGRLLDSVAIRGLKAAVPGRLVAGAPTFAKEGRTVTATIRFASGRLSLEGLDVPNARIAGGAAHLELRQAGVVSRFGRRTGSGVTIAVGTKLLGRLDVAVTAEPGAFTKLTARVAANGRALVLTLTEAPPVVQPTQPQPTQPTQQTQPTQPTQPPQTQTGIHVGSPGS